MAVSRYRNTPIIDNKHQAIFDFPKVDWNKINSFQIRVSDTDRLDNLAFKYFNDGTLWWIIAVVNDLQHPWDFASGQVIRIPVDVNDVLKHF